MQRLIVRQVFTRRDIAVLFGGNARAFLPRNPGGDIVAGCFDPAKNPRVPAEVLVHSAPNAILAAKRFLEQSSNLSPGTDSPILNSRFQIPDFKSKIEDQKSTSQNGPIPVFLRLAPNVWEYIGRFRAVRYDDDAAEVAVRVYEIHPRIYEKYVRENGEMKGILFLEEE